MRLCRLIAAITASHLSDVGCGKTGFSKKPEFFRTLYGNLFSHDVLI
jgi:hypothetical protein